MPATWPRPSSATSRSSRPSICPSIDPQSTPSFTSSRPSPPTRSTRSSPSPIFSPAISSKQQPENPLSGFLQRRSGVRALAIGAGAGGAGGDAYTAERVGVVDAVFEEVGVKGGVLGRNNTLGLIAVFRRVAGASLEACHARGHVH